MKAAVVQLAAGEDKPAALARLVAAVGRAADAGAALVVAPEAAMHDFGAPSLSLTAVAEPLDGPFVCGLAGVAAQRGVTVVAGMFERIPGDAHRAFNTVVALGPDGGLLGRYRKQHLFDALSWSESDRLAPGEPQDRLVIPVEDHLVGVMTCYDLRFPELARALVDDGATMLTVPAAWVSGPLKSMQWRTLVTARALENVCYVAAAGQPLPTYTGCSMVVDPFGVVLAELSDGGGHDDNDGGDVAVVKVSTQRLSECRERMPSLRHRRWSVSPRR